MDIASVFEWFAQESKSIAEQAAESEQREKLAELALLWASAAQQCSGGAPAMQSTASSPLGASVRGETSGANGSRIATQSTVAEHKRPGS